MRIAREILMLAFLVLNLSGNDLKARQNLWFGTITTNNTSTQARFETDSLLKNITYAPYGITPVIFKNVQRTARQLTFLWPQGQINWQCVLVKQNETTYKGKCDCKDNRPIEIVMRNFSEEDAR